MGDHFQTIADVDATAEDAEARAARVVAWLVAEGIVLPERTYEMFGKPVYSPGPRWDEVTQWPCEGGCDGLAVITGRTVFWGSLGSDMIPVCPHCSAAGTTAPWQEAMDAWHGTGAGDLRCPACGLLAPLPEWTWEDDCFAFAHLGFEIWNSAVLRPEFIAGFGRILGPRIRTVAGKL